MPGPGHEYLQGLSETVDPSSGQVSLRIQVPMPTGRQLTLPFYFAYDSNGVYIPQWLGTLGQNGSTQWTVGGAAALSSGGWTYTIPQATGPMGVSYPSLVNNGGPQQPSCNTAQDWGMFDPTGGHHQFSIVTLTLPNETCTQQSIEEQDSGGDLTYGGIVPAGAANAAGGLVVNDQSGTLYSFAGGDGLLPTQVEDRNGNLIKSRTGIMRRGKSIR